ncbi:hypothetical protein AB0K55_37250 [Streptomyces massasporeus]
MADSQTTYQHLRRELTWPGGADDQLLLLHARLPGQERESRTRLVRDRLGPTGQRPERLVVVTTSLLDMSLDIDVDVMVSDVASLHTLLQRLGRLWRFEHRWTTASPRPSAWLRPGTQPRLHVLQPTDHEGRTLIPRPWRTLEPAFLPEASAELLTHHQDHALSRSLPEATADFLARHPEGPVLGDARARPHAGLPPSSTPHAAHHRGTQAPMAAALLRAALPAPTALTLSDLGQADRSPPPRHLCRLVR